MPPTVTGNVHEAQQLLSAATCAAAQQATSRCSGGMQLKLVTRLDMLKDLMTAITYSSAQQSHAPQLPPPTTISATTILLFCTCTCTCT